MVTRRISTLKRPKHALRSAGKATIASKAPPSSLPSVIPDAWSRSSAIPPSASLSSVRKFQICLVRYVEDDAAFCKGLQASEKLPEPSSEEIAAQQQLTIRVYN